MTLTSQRKIISGVILLLAGILVTYWKGDIPEHLLSLMETLYYAFVAGNAFEHFTNMKTINNEKKVVNE